MRIKKHAKVLLAASACYSATVASSAGITIEIDYSLDTNGFFSQAGSKQAMRAVCDYFESILTDNLARIDPSEWTGETWTAKVTNPSNGLEAGFPGKVVPADTFIIYVGGGSHIGSALGQGGPAYYSAGGTGGDAQAWFNLLRSRGQSGALLNPPTDHASWGGNIVFNSTRTWNFSLTAPDSGKAGFVSTALHEVGHVLGIGTADSWFTYANAGVFTGSASVASFGGDVPLQTGGGHWRDDAACVSGTGYNPTNPLNILSKTVAQFGVPAGRDQIARMDPSGCQVGPYHLVMTELDLAGLADVGWQLASTPPAQIVPPPVLASVNPLSGDVSLSWLADPALTYQVEEAQGLSGWQSLGSPISGETGTFVFIDNDPPAGKNFYRLGISNAAASSSLAPLAFAAGPDDGMVRTVEVSARTASGCSDCGGAH